MIAREAASMTFLTPDDLTPFAEIDPVKAQAMIDDAEAMAVLAAPCITGPTFTNLAAVKAILRTAVLRWNEAGTGALTQESAGLFAQSVDTRIGRRGLLWPTEVAQLQGLCSSGSVYTLSLAGPDPT